ncbi:lytic murein transglycosylase [Sphingomonas sp. CGMCC 1.13654]|uniref:Lytic murein transglycosylase n=1 Tax=Sphingomonas chungangi TaxID=2683589 RepID=A0A838L875_9SPHN|nr:lytic murein transglycosylase [Sphingomonas chungangi]MBA2935673.1 lytic murein transglycosylase [Sphingomonas chungangi]MVW54363.1 lytic murein transglycosylase [Sphingomonas chungangi]
MAAVAAGALAPMRGPDGLAAQAQTPGGDQQSAFQAYLQDFRGRALAQGVSPRTLDSVLPTLTYSQRVVDLDQSQPGGSPTTQAAAVANFAPYRAKHVTPDLIARGRAAYAAQRYNLQKVEAETGVPESIMVAIWGQETSYGGYTGNFDLANSLATLAYEGRRRLLFEGELIATLKLIDRGIPRSQLKGSWAGATGYPQFLPSMYLRLARDGDGDGKADIWNSPADALASIGNYFVNAGWKRGEPWAVPASVPASLDRSSFTSLMTSPRCPRVFARHSKWLTMREWRARGVVQLSGPTVSDDELATLLEPDGPGATAYLTFGNYRAILDYNCSNFYALSVGLLSDSVSR